MADEIGKRLQEKCGLVVGKRVPNRGAWEVYELIEESNLTGWHAPSVGMAVIAFEEFSRILGGFYSLAATVARHPPRYVGPVPKGWKR